MNQGGLSGRRSREGAMVKAIGAARRAEVAQTSSPLQGSRREHRGGGGAEVVESSAEGSVSVPSTGGR